MTGRLDRISLVLSLLLLGGAVAERCTMLPPAEGKAYQQRVRQAFATFPTKFGDWVAVDTPVAVEAMRLLRPNSLLSRQYTNVATNERCSVLLVDCTDARDLQCHYPPVCYPGRGWKLVRRDERNRKVGGEDVVGTDYEFSRTSFENASGILAASTMILPDGRFKPDMRGVDEAAADVRRRVYGAAQIQVIVDGTALESTRERIIQSMYELHKPLFDVIRSAPR
ncbi:MAG: hypothetical protein JWN40_5014 [Phycisphaerales bacterium]|nr:hypothetical protein [Phycisphaerales bacterium]